MVTPVVVKMTKMIFSVLILKTNTMFSPDGRFSGTTCTLKVYTKLYNYDNSGLYNITRRSRSIIVRLLSISEAEFLLFKSPKHSGIGQL